MVLEPRQDGQPVQADRVGHHLADGARVGHLDRGDVEQAHALVRVTVGSREALAHDLETGAHRQHHRALGHPPGQGAVVDQGAGRPDLRPVLAAAQAVDVGLGQRPVGGRLQELGGAAAPLGPPGQDQPVAPVAVRAQEVGVDHGDP